MWFTALYTGTWRIIRLLKKREDGKMRLGDYSEFFSLQVHCER